MSLSDWWDQNQEEIGSIREFINSLPRVKDNPVARREMMCRAPGYFDRASSLAAEANGLYRVALASSWPTDGSAEQKKKQCEAASHKEEVMRDSMKGLVKSIDHLIELCRTISGDDRVAFRATGLQGG